MLAKVVASEEPMRRTSEGLEKNNKPPKVRGAKRPRRQALNDKVLIGMNFFVGVTDYDWFRQLKADNATKVNLWFPSAS